MKIDLKNTQLTIQDVRDLIASKDDSEHRQIRVDTNGILFLSDEVGADNISNISFRLETLNQGTDHVGKKAADDDAWVKRVHAAITKNWPKPNSSYIDDF